MASQSIKEINAADLRAGDSLADVHPQFLARWSPRAFAGESLKHDDVAVLVEAARWAPSCFNEQPWRFAYRLAAEQGFAALLGTLVEGNRAWAQRAGALLAVASRRRFEHNDKPSPTHEFDAGAAWMSLALQAQQMGLFAHGMAGFDHESARKVLAVPEGYELHAIVALGRPGTLSDLPEVLQARERPSSRKPLGDILWAGDFSALEAPAG